MNVLTVGLVAAAQRSADVFAMALRPRRYEQIYGIRAPKNSPPLQWRVSDAPMFRAVGMAEMPEDNCVPPGTRFPCGATRR